MKIMASPEWATYHGKPEQPTASDYSRASGKGAFSALDDDIPF
jgi:hypothetical protein